MQRFRDKQGKLGSFYGTLLYCCGIAGSALFNSQPIKHDIILLGHFPHEGSWCHDGLLFPHGHMIDHWILVFTFQSQQIDLAEAVAEARELWLSAQDDKMKLQEEVQELRRRWHEITVRDH